jgi:hypothetical protein
VRVAYNEQAARQYSRRSATAVLNGQMEVAGTEMLPEQREYVGSSSHFANF